MAIEEFLDQTRITIVELLLRVAGRIIALVIDWIFKEVIAESAREWIKSLTTTAEKVEESI
ncbi:MAG: hypothetical protein O2U62_06070 [Candidatus Bathyarchaeota archaeon]|nr:hypothetical protein [Candidatus Bathyarchaeota archaeon]